MASNLPIPEPPRTPSPTSDGPSESSADETSSLHLDPNALAPITSFSSGSFSGSNTSLTPIMPARTADRRASSSSQYSNFSQGDENYPPNPFGFQTTTYIVGKGSPAKANMGQRRGHKYKHSSISYQFFPEVAPKAPLRLPASLPIPTTSEGWKSMSREQSSRLGWCFCHLFVAAYVQWSAQGSLSLTALSHLIFYDAIGAFLCAGVEVLSNFEVWKHSSIRQPFGLARVEVLVGFAVSILLVFMGFDLVSHNLGHFLSDLGDHQPHREHKHHDISPRSIYFSSALAIGSTLVSALMLQNHARIARSLHYTSISSLPAFLNNPSHLLTLSCTGVILLTPLLKHELYEMIDKTLSTAMAILMCLLGFQLVQSLGAMLLMSYTPPSGDSSGTVIQEILAQIEADANVRGVEEAKFWQVHHGLCMATLKLRVRGSEEALTKLRERVQVLIKDRLGGAIGKGPDLDGGPVWEISTQLMIEQN